MIVIFKLSLKFLSTVYIVEETDLKWVVHHWGNLLGGLGMSIQRANVFQRYVFHVLSIKRHCSLELKKNFIKDNMFCIICFCISIFQKFKEHKGDDASFAFLASPPLYRSSVSVLHDVMQNFRRLDMV